MVNLHNSPGFADKKLIGFGDSGILKALELSARLSRFFPPPVCLVWTRHLRIAEKIHDVGAVRNRVCGV
jgi:hypothetical protein